MNIPIVINTNTYLAYKSKTEVEPARTLKAEVFDWNFNHPKTLVEICIEKISVNWTGWQKCLLNLYLIIIK